MKKSMQGTKRLPRPLPGEGNLSRGPKLSTVNPGGAISQFFIPQNDLPCVIRLEPDARAARMIAALKAQRQEMDLRKPRKLTRMTQAALDHWHGRSWFTGPVARVFKHLQEFLWVSYHLSRLRFESFRIDHHGRMCPGDRGAKNVFSAVFVVSSVDEMTGCPIYEMWATQPGRPIEYWTFSLEPLEG